MCGMLFAQRVASLQRLEQNLRRLVREESVRRATKGSPQAELKKLEGLKEKLLFRRIPIAFSLLERSLPPGAVLQNVPPDTCADASPTSIDRKVSEESTRMTPTKFQHRLVRDPSCMMHLLSALHCAEHERRSLYRRHMARLESRLRTAREAERRAQRRQDKRAEAHKSLQEAKADAALLENSLLARPYVSVRLWRRLLLREEVWQSAVQESRRDTGKGVVLLLMLLAVTRIVIGVMQDVVGGQKLNTHAPRFVASLPSIKRRRMSMRMRKPVDSLRAIPAAPTATAMATASTASASSVGDVDTELLMLSTMSLLAEALKAPEAKPSLRWLPAPSSDAAPLVLETLAMCSLVLPHLDTSDLVRRGRTPEIFELLRVLQASASSLLAMRSALPAEPSASLHRTLRRLEDAMLRCGEGAAAALTAQRKEALAGVQPTQAARLLLALDAMLLLPRAGDRGAGQLITALVGRVFPQLSTGTQRALLEQARKTSLFAFATRGHRAKLRRTPGAGAALLTSHTRAQARLQQRQMQSALRGRRLEAVNGRSAELLAKDLSVHALTTLLGIIARTACDTQGDAQGRLVTASLLVAESLFISADSQRGRLLHPGDLPNLLSTLSVLWSVVGERFEMVRHSSNRPLEVVSKTEMLVVTHLTEYVFTAVNAAVARRVDLAEQPLVNKPSSLSTTEENEDGVKDEIFSVHDIVDMVYAMTKWCNLSTSNRNSTYVETTARLLRRLLIADVPLWKEVRQLGETQHESFIRSLTEVMQTCNVMDTILVEALSAVC